ncbi:MAG: hypothetical protein QM296_07550 [Bacillota bacterium]|nr:hypothetical protein [Bacillota bacterium]
MKHISNDKMAMSKWLYSVLAGIAESILAVHASLSTKGPEDKKEVKT